MKRLNKFSNKKYLVLPAVLLLLLASSCTKQLNYTPEVFLSAEQIYADQAGATAGITGIYQQLQTLKKSDYALIGIIGTDEARCTYQNQGYGAYYAGITGLDVYDLTFNSQNADISGYWSVCYKGIANANAALENIPAINNFADVTVKNRLMGEASFLRALFYFQLVQLFGDIPMPLQKTSFTDGIPRTPISDVYNQIIIDLKYAATNLWIKSKNPDAGRASMEAAKALLGKVYLTIHDYPNAKTTFEDLLTNNSIILLPKYSDLFKIENNAESLFEIQYSQESGNTNNLANYFGSSAGAVVPGGPTPTNATPGYGGNVVIATKYYSDSVFTTTDTRFAASITAHYYANINLSSNYDWWVDIGLPHINKYDILSSGSTNASNSTKNEYYLRSADVYLMYAEVLNELGQTTAALKPLNTVRNRAALQNIEVAWGRTPSQTELRDELMVERVRELGGEGWRWFDLKRTGTLVNSVMAHNNPKLYYMTKNHTLVDAHPAQNVSAKNNLYPIPLAELQNNSALTLTSQNPGY